MLCGRYQRVIRFIGATTQRLLGDHADKSGEVSSFTMVLAIPSVVITTSSRRP
jgi:hypothetical protein